MTALAFIDDMTFSQLFSSGLVWATQVLRGKLCDCALQEVSSDARLGQSWCALFKKKQKTSKDTMKHKKQKHLPLKY